MATIEGVLVCMSAGLYRPYIEVEEGGRKSVCEYGSRLARESGLENPKHWAHAVYAVLSQTCADRQTELQGGSMKDYEETQTDRDEAERARRHGFGC